MKRASLAATLLASIALAVGCASFQKGESIVKYEKDGPVRVTEAPATGRYALYSGSDLVNSQIQYHLNKGDQLGFVNKDGAVYAVAGDHQDRITTQGATHRYYWRRIKENM